MLTLRSPAKVNLFLRILYRRPDGYHELASLFQTISLCDTLHFEFAEHDTLTCTDPTIPTDHTNLVLKAADLFRRKTGMKFGVRAHLEKHIPPQSGLGGGSGNAATTLWALNQLCGTPAEDIDLADWAADIGSDISFFFSHGTAYCTGRGEKLRAVNPPPSVPLYIVKPPQGLSTPEVYRNLNATQLTQRDPEHFLQEILKGKTCYFNDLEIPALKLLPSLADFKQQLYNSGFHTVTMTGSGSAFFCLGTPKPLQDSKVFFYPSSFLHRTPLNWY